jgi:DNA-binding transcriptional MerR regulator
MSEAAQIEIPARALFKATEVCELVQVQPYVLRTWEAEFPNLGVAKAAGAARIYRREDVERVVRIKHLLLVEGLTLAGARRKIEADAEPAGDLPEMDTLLSASTRQRLTAVKQGLRSILDLLTAKTPAGEFTLTPVASAFPSSPRLRRGSEGSAEVGSRTSELAPSAGSATRAKTAGKAGSSSRPKRSA